MWENCCFNEKFDRFSVKKAVYMPENSQPSFRFDRIFTVKRAASIVPEDREYLYKFYEKIIRFLK